jgi:hypothetical protein
MPMEIIVVYYENRTKHTDILCGHVAEFIHFKAVGKYRNHYALRVYLLRHSKTPSGALELSELYRACQKLLDPRYEIDRYEDIYTLHL